MKIKKVYKYGTGQEIPKGAIYLCTKTVNLTYKNEHGGSVKENLLVWHYFLVEIEKE